MTDDPTMELNPEFQVYRALQQKIKEQAHMLDDAMHVIRDLANMLPHDLYHEWLNDLPDWLAQELTK